MTKKILTGIILFIVLGGLMFATVNSEAFFEEEVEEHNSGYFTLKGSLSNLGTGTFAYLIFTDDNNDRYRVNQKEEQLRNLTGRKMILTGYIEDKDSQLPEIEVEDYNTYYELTEEEKEVSILGKIKQDAEDTYLLTPDQTVVRLDRGHYDAFSDYIDRQMVVRGEAVKTGDHKAEMEVRSFREIE